MSEQERAGDEPEPVKGAQELAPAEAGPALGLPGGGDVSAAPERAELEAALRDRGVEPEALAAAAARREETEHFTQALVVAYGALHEEDLRAMVGERGWSAAQGLLESGRLAKRTYPDEPQPRSRWVQPLGQPAPSTERRSQIVAAVQPGAAYLALLMETGAATSPAPGARAERETSWLRAGLAGLVALGLVLGLLYLAVTQNGSGRPAARPPVTATAEPAPAAGLATAVVTVTPQITPEPTPPGPTPTLVVGEECGRAVVSGTLGDVLTLRANPTTSAGIIKRIAEGTELTLLCDEPRKAEGRTWYRVRTRAGEQGWVSGAYLTRV